MGFVMDISDTVTVLNFGRLIFDGPAAAARQDPTVIEAYLGQKVAARLAQGARADVRGADDQPRRRRPRRLLRTDRRGERHRPLAVGDGRVVPSSAQTAPARPPSCARSPA